ncbi:hypothetical protein SDC9_203298 [bioreactor metagenome]|uniref:Uncharacterized protein n=1 Tax=bioreactor metagenome TaxID=1076179 RepID=A0A645J561_9ZZZZ|nr:hypothetical protein [Candidatus Pelethousia sp.]
MTLQESEGKKVKVYFVDGESMTGTVSYYTSALDNEPDPASITIGHVELFEPEIKRIELLNT